MNVRILTVSSNLACVEGARRGGGIGEIRRALEHKGSTQEGGGPPSSRSPFLALRARFSPFARIPLAFPLLALATQASSNCQLNSLYLLLFQIKPSDVSSITQRFTGNSSPWLL